MGPVKLMSGAAGTLHRACGLFSLHVQSVCRPASPPLTSTAASPLTAAQHIQAEQPTVTVTSQTIIEKNRFLANDNRFLRKKTILTSLYMLVTAAVCCSLPCHITNSF